MAQRMIIDGNMVYREIENAKTQQAFTCTFWDFWIAIAVVKKYGSDWDALLDALREKVKANYSQQSAGEAMLAHVRRLRQALDEAGLRVDDLLEGADDALLKKEEKKAVRKVLNLDFQSKEKSAWMLLTPRKIRAARAMRGYWDRFPVDPAEYADTLTRRYKTSGYYSENQSFGLEEKLSGFLEKQTARASLPKQVAVYRAFLSVVIEKMEMVDDSFGVIGQLYGEAFTTYYGLERAKLEMSAEDFLQDLLELLIWEDYGLTYEQLPGFFANLSAAEVPIAERILQQQWQELKELEIEYQAEEALTMLGELNVQHQRFDNFLHLAEVMGSRAWRRITTMAEMAEQHQRYDLAMQVYETALQPGMHQSFLREKYTELKHRHPMPNVA